MKIVKIIGAVLLAFVISGLVNFLLVGTILGESSLRRPVLNILEILGIIIAVILIIRIVSKKSK